MKRDRMTNPDHPPLDEEICAQVGAQRFGCWQALAHFLQTTYAIEPLWKYESKANGWGMYWRKGGRALCTLYPERDGLLVMLVLGRQEGAAALAARDTLGENVGSCLEQAGVFHDGRWLFIDVQSARDVEDIQRLLLIKKRPPKAQRA